jgi:hypothetical protein
MGHDPDPRPDRAQLGVFRGDVATGESFYYTRVFQLWGVTDRDVLIGAKHRDGSGRRRV